MKKFLSLVLALIMTMSLVTIGAGAVSYDELTDKDEISSDREEAVAVLNAISIIEGYPDGSYKPQAALTRQVAAKFIVSLLIGPEAAKNLTVATAPYPDVPLGTEWAGYISYCKTANIISGYSDGTFRPEGPLTGYAFAKMLLGALGYRGDIEGFTGTGWTMNVAKIGNAANLFDRLKFQGGETLNREDAAQLCLNTLKATMVEYTGGFNITAGDATVVGAMTRSYVTSNQDYSKNISRRRASNAGSNDGTVNHYTVEFGEEHFKDLRMNEEGSWLDDFGRPSNHWSWKKVTVGVFPVEPDFIYTEQMTILGSNPSDASKVNALGLNGYKVNVGEDTKLFWNGTEAASGVPTVASIANCTDYGTVVEVYVDENVSDWISHVVVIQTQLMQVKKVTDDAVTLKLYKDSGADKIGLGFNQNPFDVSVEAVETDDECFEFLSGLKADDIVAVVPVSPDRGDTTFTVAAAYKPETVTGALTGSATYANKGMAVDSERSVVQVTVGGTDYKVANWNKDLTNINRDILKVTKKDVTLYLDEFGNAMLAKDVGSTNDYMILSGWRAQVVNGNVVTIAEGWDIKGNAVSLNIGAQGSAAEDAARKAYKAGDVLHYSNANTSNSADWTLSKYGVYNVEGNEGNETYAVRASNQTIKMSEKTGTDELKAAQDDMKPLRNKDIVTIYVAFDDDKEVEYIEIKDGLQNIYNSELGDKKLPTCYKAEATLKLSSSEKVDETSDVTAIIIKDESNDASLKNLGYVYDYNTTNQKDESGNVITDYRVLTQDGDDVRMKSTDGVGNRVFVRYTELEDGMYRLKKFTTRIGSGTSALEDVVIRSTTGVNQKNNNMYLLALPGVSPLAVDANKSNIYSNINPNGTQLTEGDQFAGVIDLKGAKILDLRKNVANKDKIDNLDGLKDLITGKGTVDSYSAGGFGKHLTVDIAFNDNPSSDDFRLVYYVILKGDKDGKYEGEAAPNTVNPFTNQPKPEEPGATEVYMADKSMAKSVVGTVEVTDAGTAYATFTITKPDWVKFSSKTDADSYVKITQWSLWSGEKPLFRATGANGTISSNDPGPSADLTELIANTATEANITSFKVTNLQVASQPTYLIPKEYADNVEMHIDAIQWGEIAVQFKDGNKAEVVKASGATTETLPTTLAASNSGWATQYLDVFVDNVYYGLGSNDGLSKMTISGTTTDVTAADAKSIKIIKNGGKTQIDTSTLDGATNGTFTATGTGYVTVTLKDLKEAAGHDVKLYGYGSPKNATGSFVVDEDVQVTIDTLVTGGHSGDKLTFTATGLTNGTNEYTGTPGTKFGIKATLSTKDAAGDTDYYIISYSVVDAVTKQTLKSVGPVKLNSTGNGDPANSVKEAAEIDELTLAHDSYVTITQLDVVKKATVSAAFKQIEQGGAKTNYGVITLTFANTTGVKTFNDECYELATNSGKNNATTDTVNKSSDPTPALYKVSEDGMTVEVYVKYEGSNRGTTPASPDKFILDATYAALIELKDGKSLALAGTLGTNNGYITIPWAA